MDFLPLFFLLLGITVLGMIASAFFSMVETGKKIGNMGTSLSALPDFTPTQVVFGCDGSSGLAIDEPRMKICLITHVGEGSVERVFLYKDIISVELLEDGDSVTKTVRSSQIKGAIVGGIVLGGVGAIIGGLSGRQETSETVKRVSLKIVVNDVKAPLHDVAFVNTEVRKDWPAYRQAITQANQWHGIVEVLIKRADAEEKAPPVERNRTSPVAPLPSVADELKKLADLHSSGVLTLEEFLQQKTKVLGSNQPIS